MEKLIERIREELLPEVSIESKSTRDPVVVRNIPAPWRLLGAGNYAAVFVHPEYPKVVVKVYSPGRPGFEDEVEVYRRLSRHPAFSECCFAENGFLVLKQLHGVTLYDCVHRGLPIPEQVIHDIDEALAYARERGLRPHDVHGRNVMMQYGRGLVVDVSDFLKQGECSKWADLKKAYYRLYRPIVLRFGIRVPSAVLNLTRKSYRFFRRLAPKRTKDAVTSLLLHAADTS